MENKRDWSLDLYRALLMYGICLLHSSYWAASVKCAWLEHVLLFCVTGFVFISGWYGIKFTFRKLVGLYGIALYAAFCVSIVGYLQNGVWGLKIVRSFFLTYWFLNAYAVLMMFSPAINKALTVHLGKSGEVKYVVWIAAILYATTCGWTFMRCVPRIATFIPKTEGLGDYTAFMMIGTYALARIIRVLDVERCFSKWRCLAMLCFCIGCFVMFPWSSGYASPFAAMAAVSSMFLVKKVEIGERAASVLKWMTPSVFSIYLLHSNGPGFTLMKDFSRSLIGFGCPSYLSYLIVSICTFAICLVLDQPRRAIVACVRGACQNFWSNAK